MAFSFQSNHVAHGLASSVVDRERQSIELFQLGLAAALTAGVASALAARPDFGQSVPIGVPLESFFSSDDVAIVNFQVV